MPKLPHSRHDTARAKRVDGDGGFKAAIWGGALAARHACVGGCKPERYHSVDLLRGGSSSFYFFLPPPFYFICFQINKDKTSDIFLMSYPLL